MQSELYTKRLTLRKSSHPLPDYVFIPGSAPRPSEKLPDIPLPSDLFNFGSDLLNLGYFWESHVIFEHLWNLNYRTTPIAKYYQSLVLMGAAGVKYLMLEPKLADSHLLRASELYPAGAFHHLKFSPQFKLFSELHPPFTG